MVQTHTPKQRHLRARNKSARPASDKEGRYCALCKTSFQLPKDYDRHKKTSKTHHEKAHPGVPYQFVLHCQFCGQGFTRLDAMYRHLEVCGEANAAASPKSSSVDTTAEYEERNSPIPASVELENMECTDELIDYIEYIESHEVVLSESNDE
ncbi:hypothetical protein C8Q75DRAFT_838339 [Abortiporus biennis]|nr:hypothetical protein C8Q75DRAFT_838339 [Abortiporus biennis]